jgi:hypothetical protein
MDPLSAQALTRFKNTLARHSVAHMSMKASAPAVAHAGINQLI